MPAQANQPLPDGTGCRTTASCACSPPAASRSSISRTTRTSSRWRSRNTCPRRWRCASTARRSPQVAEENLALFRYGMKCFFEEGRRARAPVASQRGARAELLPRQRDRVPGDALRARPHAAGAHPARQRGPLEELWIRSTFAQLLNGLREVHTNKLLHLDIKPANIYLRNDGTPLLIDFGAARQVLSAEGMKLPPMYTPGFAAPEHARPARAARALERHLLGRRDACTPASPARRRSRRTRAKKRRGGAGAPRLGRQVLRRAARHHRLVPALDHLERPQSVFALQKALLG